MAFCELTHSNFVNELSKFSVSEPFEDEKPDDDEQALSPLDESSGVLIGL